MKLVYFIGIGGISQSALANILLSRGVSVAGSDLHEGPEVQALRTAGVQVFISHKAANLTRAGLPDAVIYTGAISSKNPELLRAQKLGIKIIKRDEFLGMLSRWFNVTVSVSGCHGKTTTTSMIAYCMRKLSPTAHVGGVMVYNGKNYAAGEGNFFITEACEFQRSFLRLTPDVNVVMNIDADHLDCYKNMADLKAAFTQFAKQTRAGGTLIYSGDDKNSLALSRIKLNKGVQKISFGLNAKNDIKAENIKTGTSGVSFNLVAFGRPAGNFKLNLIGNYNVTNALACYAALHALGHAECFAEICTFQNSRRRFELVGKVNGAQVVHDYAHHPTEISAVLAAAKGTITNGGRLFAVFEPHTYTRTEALMGEFTACFSDANQVVLLPVYAARERPIKGITSFQLAKKIKGAKHLSSFEKLKTYLRAVLKPNDLCLLLGAGTIGTVKF